jgi:hypothetical protein
MKNASLFTLSLVIDLNPDEATKPFGVKIIKADLPAGFAWAISSAMNKHGVLPLKAIAVKAEKAAPVAAPVAVHNEASVQAALAQPGVAEFLATLMQARGTAATAEAPTLNQARKPGRPRKS